MYLKNKTLQIQQEIVLKDPRKCSCCRLVTSAWFIMWVNYKLQIAVYFIIVIIYCKPSKFMMTDNYFLVSLHLSHFSSTQHQALRKSLRYERSDGVSFPQGNKNFCWRASTLFSPPLSRCHLCVCRYSRTSLTTPPGSRRGDSEWSWTGNKGDEIKEDWHFPKWEFHVIWDQVNSSASNVDTKKFETFDMNNRIF